MKKRGKLFAVSALTSLLAMIGSQAAIAGTTGGGDGQTGQPRTGATGAIEGNCDTLDALKTAALQSRAAIHYACRPNIDITGWSLTSTTRNGVPVLQSVWNVSGKIPTTVSDFGIPGSALRTGEATGVNFVMFFKNPHRQNARQTTGFTTTCAQFTKSGPWLTGNDEWLALTWSVVLVPDQNLAGDPAVSINQGWAHFDPEDLTLTSQVGTGESPDPVGGTGGASRCVYNSATDKYVPTPGFKDLGTDQGADALAWSASGGTLTTWTPMTFHTNGGATGLYMPYDYVLAAPGDPIQDVFPQVQGLVNIFHTPAIYDPTDPATELEGPLFLAANPPLDWADWDAFDQGVVPYGTMTIGSAAVAGPSCPLYRQSVMGPGSNDNDLQYNPTFATGTPPTGGLTHYDSTRIGRTRSNVKVSVAAGVSATAPIAPQNDFGPTGCYIPVPGTQIQRGNAAADFTA